jgi:hypothetical protein
MGEERGGREEDREKERGKTVEGTVKICDKNKT